MPYYKLPRPRACSEGQVPNGSSVSDEGHFGAQNTDGVGSGLPMFQEGGHGGCRSSRNRGTAVYRDIYAGARSSGATNYSFFSSWRMPDQWWHHEGGFDFHRDYVFRGTHDYARAGNRYHYRYTGNADSCDGGGKWRTSGTNAWDTLTRTSYTRVSGIRTSAPWTLRGTSPRRESISPTH